MSHTQVDDWIRSFGLFFSKPLSSIFDAVSKRVFSVAFHSISILLQLGLAALVFSALVGISTAFYLCFYYIAIPTYYHERPVYFDFTPDQGSPGATVSLVHEQWFYTGVSAHLIPPAKRLLAASEGYDIYLDLVVPDIASNHDTGMVMIKASINSGHVNSENAKLLAHSARPILPPFSSTPIRLCRQMFMLMPLLIGITDEYRTLEIPMFEGFVENGRHPSTHLNLTLSTTGDGLRVHTAKLRFVIQLSGIRYFTYHWFLSSAFVSIVTISSFMFLTLVSVYWINWMTRYARSSKLNDTRKYAREVPPAMDRALPNFESDEISNEGDIPRRRGSAPPPVSPVLHPKAE